jgi:hypothetical protein
MQQFDPKAPRLKLILGKYPVTSVRRRPIGPGWDVTIRFHEVSFTMSITFETIDVRPNDLVTIYTEIPYGGLIDAHALPPPIE